VTLPSATDELNDLCRAVSQSRAAVADGASVELAGLDAEVARVIDIAKNAPSIERSQVLAAIHTLLREIDGLAVDVRRQHDSASARQAAGAYRPEPGPS
jgi:hypothetical protein